MATHPRRKAFGQHFLKDQALCEKLTDLCLENLQKHNCRSLVEIGPGAGALTEPMIRKLVPFPSIRFSVAEMDRKWANHWRGVVHLWDADFLRISESEWLSLPPVGILSNLPYSSGTRILVTLAEHPERIPFMILMFQAEVAQRIRAEPATKSWGSLSLWIQNFWEVSKIESVAPGAFQPPPAVNSEVVLLKPRSSPKIPAIAFNDSKAKALWEKMLRASFAHRRKMLRAGLAAFPELKKALELSGIDPTLRAEALSWDQWEIFFRSAYAQD